MPAFAGTGQTTFIQPDAYGDDGHHLFYDDGGSAIWGPLVQHYLDGRGIGPH